MCNKFIESENSLITPAQMSFSKPPTVELENSKSSLPAIDECMWAVERAELQKACYLANVCRTEPPKECRYYDIRALLQKGPTCGLTALSMLLNETVSAAELLAEAQQLNYSNNGEMFSVEYLYKLLCQHLPKSVDTNSNIDCTVSKDLRQLQTCAKECYQNSEIAIDCQIHEGQLNCAKVKKALINGACLLVPYDAFCNHSPCLKNGHKAHWALIIGYLITNNDEFFVIARHGKSKGVGVWSLASLSDSNCNLYEFAQPSYHPDAQFLIPNGGLSGPLGLRERCIIIGPGLHANYFSLP